MALFDRNRFRALGALVVCGGLMGVGGEAIGGHEDDEHSDFTLSGGAVGLSITYGTTTEATYTLGAGTFDPVTLGAITSGFASNTFILATDITGDNPALRLGGAFINTGDRGEFRINRGGVAGLIDFAETSLGGSIGLQNIDTITLDVGTADVIRAVDAEEGVTFNLLSGTITSNVFGSREDDTFIIGSGITVSGRINGGAGTDTFTATAAVNVRVTTDNSDTGGDIRLRNVETITLSEQADTLALLSGSVGRIDGGAGVDTFTLSSGTVDGDVNGGAGDDMFVIGAGITIGGTIDGGLGMDTLSLATGFTPTSANFFNSVLVLTLTGGGSIVLTLANIEDVTIADITMNPPPPLTFPAGTAGADTFAITTDITSPGLSRLESVIDGGDEADVLEINDDAIVASVAFSDQAPTGAAAGAVHLQNVETITLNGGTVNGQIDASAADASAGVTVNLVSGTIGDGTLNAIAITGSAGNDVFTIANDLTGDTPALIIAGSILGGEGDMDELQLNEGFVAESVQDARFPTGTRAALFLREIEVITVDGGRLTGTGSINTESADTGVTFNLMAGTINGSVLGSNNGDDTFNLLSDSTISIGGFIDGGANAHADTFNLESGTITGGVFGQGGDDMFSIGADILISGTIDGGPGMDTLGLATGFTPASAEIMSGSGGVFVLTLGLTGGGSLTLTLANIETFDIPDLTLAFTGGNGQANTFAISNDITSLLTTVINGRGGTDVLELNTGATVASVAFSSTTPMQGAVHLQRIETITLDGGTVNGTIDASAANAGVTFNLMSGTVGPTDTPDFCDDCFAITGSGQNDVFILSGDTTDADDDTAGVQAALAIHGLVQGGGGDQDEVRLVAGAVVRVIDFSTFAAGDLSLRAVETITIDGGTVNGTIDARTAPAITFNLMSGTIGGRVTGSDNNDTFNFRGTITISGSISGSVGADIFNIESGTLMNDVNGGDGDDTFTLSGGTVGGNINGEGNNDTFTLSSGTLTGNVNGGAGDDVIIFSANLRDNPVLDVSATVFDGQDGTADEFRLATGGSVTGLVFSDESTVAESISLQNIEIVTIDGGTVNGTLTLNSPTGLTLNMTSGTVTAVGGSGSADTFNLRGGRVNGNVLGNGGADTINLYSGITITGFLSGDGFGGFGGGGGDVLRYAGAPAAPDFSFVGGRNGLGADDNIRNNAGDVQGFESQENVAAITSLSAPAPAPGAPPVLRGAFGFEVLELAPALNLYGAMSDALMQFGAQTAQGFALADLNLATGRATQLMSKDSPFTTGRIWAHKITHSGNGKGSIGLNLTGLTARAESDYNYEMSLTQHGFDAPLATTKLGAFNLRAVSHTMTGVIETNVAEAQVSGYGAGVALLWNNETLSAHITSLAGGYEVEAQTSPFNPQAVISEITEGSFSAVNAVVSAGVADTRKLGHSLVLRTTADLVWQTLSLDDFTETGPDGLIINFDKATRFTARVGAGLEAEHWFSDVVFVHETSSGGTLSSGLSQDYKQDDGTAIEMKLGGKIADLATGLTLKAYVGMRTSLIGANSIDPSARFDLSWRF